MAPVIIPKNTPELPTPAEIKAARILSGYFKQSVEFLVPRNGFRQPTPDILVAGLLWEIKSPTGASRSTIENQIRSAVKQSENIVICGLDTKISDDEILKRIKAEVKNHKRILRVLYITKEKEIIKVLFKK